jgi:hypothetical protein
MHGSDGYISPFPLYYALGKESLWDISDRYLQVILKSDARTPDCPPERLERPQEDRDVLGHGISSSERGDYEC